MLTLVCALVLLSPDVSLSPQRVQQYLQQYHIYRAPGERGHGLPAILPLDYRYVDSQEPTPPKWPRIYRVPGEPGHGMPGLLPLVPKEGRYFNFQEGPEAPVVRVYSGPIPSRVGQTVPVKKP